MIDIHPPEHTPHTWKDFFIHIITIVVGLIIAIGLEQTVEYIHHHRQRHELLEQLDAEHRQTLKDAEDSSANEEAILNWYSARMEALQGVLADRRPYQAPPHPHLPDANFPQDPVWRAAKASGLTSLLPQQIVIVNSEPEELIDQSAVRVQEESQIYHTSVIPACGRLPLKPGTLDIDYAHAGDTDLRDCLVATMAYYASVRSVFACTAFIIGAEKAILAGDMNIDQINDREAVESKARAARLHSPPWPQ